MTSQATARRGTLPRLPRWLTRTLLNPSNLPAILVWLFLVFYQATLAITAFSPSAPFLVLINTVALFFFITRRDATRVGTKLEGAIALGGTFVASLLHGRELADTQVVPTAIQIAGLLGWVVALAALGRSLGIAPADRGLVRHGPYRFIRHPIYAFEALFFLGIVVALPDAHNLLVFSAWASLQVIRIFREERILGGYDEYRQQVRWRIIPFVW
jgi:protein-S-isoprenylcysteine O-methyltransferase Ste14